MRGVAAAVDIFFEPGEIGLGDLYIDLLREQQCDVDADALANQMLDRWQTFSGRRHLDHQVLAADILPEPFGLDDGAFGIQRQIGRHLEADETIVTLQLIIDRAQHIRRMLDVLDGELLEQLGHRAIARLQRLADGAVIFVRTADRLLEDRRVRRHALDAVAIDQLLQVAVGDEAAGEEIQPDRLAMVFECFDGIHDALFCSSWSVPDSHTFGRETKSCQQILGGADQGEYACRPAITPLTTYRSRKLAVPRRPPPNLVTHWKCLLKSPQIEAGSAPLRVEPQL